MHTFNGFIGRITQQQDTENSAIESHPQTVSPYSSFSEMTTENTDRVSANACQDTDTLVPGTALSS